MSKLKNNESGFSAVEVILVLVIVVLLGVVGWFVYKNQTKTTPSSTATTTNASTTKPTSTTTTKPADPYAGWKTYTSIMNSGLSFKYPADWTFMDGEPITKPSTNNNGGTENSVTMYSVKPILKAGTESMVSTNQYMCVTFDEYGGPWSYGNWGRTNPISSEQFQTSGKSLAINTYKGDSPMLAQLLLAGPASSHGDHFVDTKNGNYVSVEAQFNCGQGGPPGIKDLSADFNSQPETATAKLIMKSVQF